MTPSDIRDLATRIRGEVRKAVIGQDTTVDPVEVGVLEV